MSRIRRLDCLGRRHRERLPALQEKWLTVGLSTGPADRRRAEAAVETAYRLVNLHPPAHVVWLDSPLAGALAAEWFAQGGEILGSGRRSRAGRLGSRRQITELVRTQISAQVRTPVGGGVGGGVRAQVDRYVVNGGGQPIHADESGTLYRCEWPREEPQLMVRVMNSTPEPDGSFKHYVLRVPPTITTAREAIAWTFQMSGQDYHPSIET
jgi:hypothetical protein